ncbi:WXG100 family type VII secretion target [Amycolatopsis pigmentata]|uniref:WXG100 family type VII secretion target n=1 Tax=Amycolatopsis pigmentata TaxID=450801 RepID=A0ABW5G584_9PSEU
MTDVNEPVENAIIWILQKVGLNLGTGHPQRVEQKAEELRQYAETLRREYDGLNRDLAGLGDSFSGRAADAHAEAWAKHMMLAGQVADGADGMAKTLDQHADESTRIIRTIIGIALELLEMWLLCVALSWITGFLSDLIFFSRAGRLIAELYKLFTRLGELIRTTTEAMKQWGTFAGKIGEYTRVLLVEYVPDGIKEYPINLAATAVPAKLSGRNLDVGSLLLPMIPAIVQYGALNLGMEILENETKVVGGLKRFIEGKKEEPSAPELPMPDAGKPLPQAIAESPSLSSELRNLLEREFPHDRPAQQAGDAARAERGTSMESAERPETVHPLPAEYELPMPEFSRPLAEEMAEDVTLSPELRSLLEREFNLKAQREKKGSETEPATEEVVFTPKTNRELLYAFLKETLVNGTQNILLGAEQGQHDNWLSNAAIGAPLGGLRKVALEKYLKPAAYQGKPAEAPLGQRIVPEMTMRTLAYGLRNTVREAVEDAANGDPVTTQLTQDTAS